MAHLTSKITSEFLCVSDQGIVPYLQYHLIFFLFMVARINFFYLLWILHLNLQHERHIPDLMGNLQLTVLDFYGAQLPSVSDRAVWYTTSALLLLGFLPLPSLVAPAASCSRCGPWGSVCAPGAGAAVEAFCSLLSLKSMAKSSLFWWTGIN